MKVPKTVLFTHNDLDGAGCAILAKKLYKEELKVVFCDRDTIDPFLLEAIKREKNILITDISPRKETCLQIDKAIKERDDLQVELIDHHITRSWVNEYEWGTFDNSACGTLLLFNKHFSKERKALNSVTPLQRFALSVDSWDRWVEDSIFRSRGEKIKLLCYFLGLDNFIGKYKEDILKSDFGKLNKILNLLVEQRDRYVQEVVNNQLNTVDIHMDGYANMFKIIFATDFFSEIGNAILNHEDGRELKYVCLVNPITNSVHMRSRKGGTDISLIAKECRGGGHAEAAGFGMNFTRKIEEKIEKKLNMLN